MRRFIFSVAVLLLPGTFFVLYPNINSDIGLALFLFLFFVSVIETVQNIKHIHEK